MNDLINQKLEEFDSKFQPDGHDKYGYYMTVNPQLIREYLAECIEAVCEQRESAAKKEGAREVVEAIPDNHEHGNCYLPLKARLKERFLQ